MSGENLPRDEDGHFIRSADFGFAWLVKVEYNTNEDGSPLPEDTEVYPETLHGPFNSIEEAVEWMDDYPDDPDTHEVSVVVMNKVRP